MKLVNNEAREKTGKCYKLIKDRRRKEKENKFYLEVNIKHKQKRKKQKQRADQEEIINTIQEGDQQLWEKEERDRTGKKHDRKERNKAKILKKKQTRVLTEQNRLLYTGGIYMR